MEGNLIAEGKTKIIREITGTGEVIIENKDTITAGDGSRRDIIPGKGTWSTQITSNCFSLLEKSGIETHFVERVADKVFHAKKAEMIPIEIVLRRYAYQGSSYIKRHPAVAAHTRFRDLTFEMFAKDDANHDPILDYDFHSNGGSVNRYLPNTPMRSDTLIDCTPLAVSRFAISPDIFWDLERIGRKTFDVLEAAWAEQGVVLADMKTEFGFVAGKLVVADVIDADSMRLWPEGDPARMVDKQLYREGRSLDEVAAGYEWVANATTLFSKTN